MAATDGEWPPPDDSSRVIALLTVSEGLLVGSLGTFLLSIILALASLQAESPVETAGIAGLLVVFVALIGRILWNDITTVYAGQEGSNVILEDSYTEWQRTWPPLSVLLIAALVGTAFRTVAVVRIGWVPIGWIVLGAPVLYGTLVFGFARRVYVPYKIRGTIHH